jgi:hypothetical protein
MRIAKSRVVNLFIMLGCPKAVKWNNEVLTGRVATIHELFSLDMALDEKYKKLFEKIYQAAKDNIAIEIIDDTDNPAEEIIRNVDTTLKMKPIEESTENQTVVLPKSESEVTIVPDVDELDDELDDDNEINNNQEFSEGETIVEQIKNDAVETEIADGVENEAKIESKVTDNSETSETIKNVSTESVQSDTEKAANLPVYKSKFGRPQQIRRPLFNFEMLDIPIGAELHFTKDPTKVAVICGKKTVQFQELFGDTPVSLTNLTKQLLNAPRDIQPTGFWTYEGVTLKTLYYTKYSTFQSVPNTDKPKKEKSTVTRESHKIPQKTQLEVFDWGMPLMKMNPVEHCLLSDSLTIEDMSKTTNLSISKVTQLLTPLVRYGLVLQNENGTFTRKTEQLTEIE